MEGAVGSRCKDRSRRCCPDLAGAETVLANWARDPRPSEFDAEISLEIDRIKQAVLKGNDLWIKGVCGDLQGALRRMVALEKRARRQAGRGLMHRTDTWRTVRLAAARFL